MATLSPTSARAATAISRPRPINIAFVVEEGARAYIERINIRGNTRTRDYVIRREFDLGEGDAYNRALVDRAERRLKNLNFFKTVKITNEPGSAPDRVVINVDVEEQPTGEFSVSGGYSTADGFIAEVSVADRNLMGRGNYAQGVGHLRPVRHAASNLSFVEPYLVRLPHGRRNRSVRAPKSGIELCVLRHARPSATNLRLGFAVTEEIAFQPRYSFYQQKITLPISSITVNFRATHLAMAGPASTRRTRRSTVAGGSRSVRNVPFGCYADGEAHLPCVRNWPRARSTCRWWAIRVSYNTLDNNRASDQRPLHRTQAGFCRRRRRRELHPHVR